MQATAGMGFNGVGTDAFNAALDQIQASPLYASSVTDSEDCLTVNVVAPKVIPAGGLPVVAWMCVNILSFIFARSFSCRETILTEVSLFTVMVEVSSMEELPAILYVLFHRKTVAVYIRLN